MTDLEQKYRALLDEARRRGLPGIDDIQLCFRLLSLSAAIDRDCAARLAPHGLSEGRFVLLFLLDAADDEGLAPGALARQAGVTRATVTGLLDGLERDGLVERHADLHDRRALRVRLTSQGRQMAAEVVVQHGRWIAGVFGGLSPDERARLSHLIEKAATTLPPSHTP